MEDAAGATTALVATAASTAAGVGNTPREAPDERFSSGGEYVRYRGLPSAPSNLLKTRWGLSPARWWRIWLGTGI